MILDKFRLDGKVALVTGSSSGIGQAIAIALAEAGADVACHSRAQGGAAQTIAAIQNADGSAFEVSGDMADATVPSRIVHGMVESRGHIDILINNAGTIRRAPAADFSEEDWAA